LAPKTYYRLSSVALRSPYEEITPDLRNHPFIHLSFQNKMYARSVLITGSSRGLGLELIRQFAPSVEILIATCRKPDEAEVSNF
jgi:hypothetical protein